MNKLNHRNVVYHDVNTVNKAINNPFFCNLTPIDDELYEVKSLKRQIVQDLPLQVGLNVYCESKLHMLKFVHLFLKKYIPKRHFEPLESDTDSLYISISKNNLEDCVPDNLKRNFYKELFHWMPAQACDVHKQDYIETKVKGLPWNVRLCCQNAYQYNKRTPGLFKLEYEAEKTVCLSAKMHLFTSKNHTKQVSKSVSLKTNRYTFEDYCKVLMEKTTQPATNKGFMQRNHQTLTYTLQKRGLSPFYCKRFVLEDGVHTKCLDV